MKPEMITVIHADTSAPINFKDVRLKKATEKIISIYTQAAAFADEKNREIAKVLSDVAAKEAYKADGFKSVADYANSIFGINRQNAYALASAGKVYKDPNTPAELKAMSPSKLAELSSVKPEVVKAAIESGEISSKTTQKDLRAFANKAKDEEPKKAEIVITYTAVPAGLPYDWESYSEILNTPRTLEEWDGFFEALVSERHESKPETIKLPMGKFLESSKKATINRRLYMNKGYSIAVEFFTYTPSKVPPKPTAPKFTREELLAMLAAMDETDIPEESNSGTTQENH